MKCESDKLIQKHEDIKVKTARNSEKGEHVSKRKGQLKRKIIMLISIKIEVEGIGDGWLRDYNYLKVNLSSAIA